MRMRAASAAPRRAGLRAPGRVAPLALLLALAVLLAAGALLALPSAAAAQEIGYRPQPESDAARRAIGQLRSPYCPGLMLEVCPSANAEMLRDSIRMLANQGTPPDEIVEWMIANHGEEWRAAPKRSGLGLWAWILPPLVLLLGAGVVGHRIRLLRRGAVTGDASPLSPEEQAELDGQLAAALTAEEE
jgi:cytochrome c-type biogenesis protein CcmH/NrfF